MYNNQGVWITDASFGIGEALALELSERGARLILSGHRDAFTSSQAWWQLWPKP
jgi:short-subunit dehydrogenase